VTNLPPCLKVKEGFLGIGQDLEKITGKTKTPLVDCVPRRSAISPVHCDGCLDWVEHYYTDVRLLYARIKTLTSQNDLLKQENLDLKEHAEREAKCIKRSGNIVINNMTSVKEIINSELSDPSLVDF
jgi:hypothetical protein